ncbi:flagellar hook-basal body complex protein FliE [uncultured Tyzzerella sp.]|uniref:flagellar hook-basal body complex protein FliE n=1 Tax=uncultured Tyzzerella sp. TaxID=2321398 RepID=UPI0029428DB4|nr:flagellar hook-basal body complex protein FliE [uncultured Tyzzerella sp.]
MLIENNIQAIGNGLKFTTDVNVDKMSKTDPFSKFFDQAVNLLDETNVIQKDVEQKQIDFITGKSDDMIALSMAQSRANSAIQFTSQVTNKILTAYQEIMRIAI